VLGEGQGRGREMGLSRDDGGIRGGYGSARGGVAEAAAGRAGEGVRMRAGVRLPSRPDAGSGVVRYIKWLILTSSPP